VIHSREITGNAEPFSQQISERLTLLTASTLRLRKDLRNGKLRLHCVNTVEHQNFLWNGKEKCGLIRTAARKKLPSGLEAAIRAPFLAVCCPRVSLLQSDL
jgi:hypothetical protein